MLGKKHTSMERQQAEMAQALNKMKKQLAVQTKLKEMQMARNAVLKQRRPDELPLPGGGYVAVNPKTGQVEIHGGVFPGITMTGGTMTGGITGISALPATGTVGNTFTNVTFTTTSSSGVISSGATTQQAQASAAKLEEKLAPKKELTLTFGTEPIVAWRMWNVISYFHRDGRSEPLLAPYAGGPVWVPMKRNEAMCRAVYGHTGASQHDAPLQSCMCGYWGLRDQSEFQHLPARGFLIGEVYLWGRVIEFEKGYRAQYAYPKSLAYALGSKQRFPSVLPVLQKRYGLPITELE